MRRLQVGRMMVRRATFARAFVALHLMSLRLLRQTVKESSLLRQELVLQVGVVWRHGWRAVRVGRHRHHALHAKLLSHPLLLLKHKLFHGLELVDRS